MPTAATSARQSLWAVRAAAGEPAAVVRVHNLQATIRGAAVAGDDGAGGGTVPDAWGRGGRAQPLLVSADVQMAQGFRQAAASDSVAADTVHYGTLSKAILEVLEEGDSGGGTPRATLYDVLETVWARLTGRRLDGTPARREQQQQQQQQQPPPPPPLLTPAHVRALTLTLHLPKAALVGDGVSLTAAGLLGTAAAAGPHALRLQLHGLRVPVLVGVHAHERRARQTVVARVAVDLLLNGSSGSGSGGADPLLAAYPQLTQRVVDVLQTSAFETLEALAAEVAETVLAWPGGGDGESGDTVLSPHRVHVALQKPMAVPFADAPEVAVVVDRASSSRAARGASV